MLKRSTVCVFGLLYLSSNISLQLASASDSSVSSVPNYRGEEDPYPSHNNPALKPCSSDDVSFRIKNRTDMYMLFDVISRENSKIIFDDWKLKPNGDSMGWCLGGHGKNFIVEFDAYPDSKGRQLRAYNVTHGGGTYSFIERNGEVVLTKK